VSKKKRKKKLLGGHVYLVEDHDTGKRVHKVPNKKDDGGIYFVDKNGACNCKASEYENDCKHILLANSTLAGEPLRLRRAKQLVEDYLDKLRGEYPNGRLVSLTSYRESKEDVNVGVAVGYNVLSDLCQTDRLVIWTQFGPLLLRLHCFTQLDQFQRVLRNARKRVAKTKRPPHNGSVENQEQED